MTIDQMRRWMFVVIASVHGCGRIGFDYRDDGSTTVSDVARDGVGATGDGAFVNCGTLPATCGPTQTSPCCESPAVIGGTYARSYDGVGLTDMSFTATVSTFRLDKYEVTVAQFRRFVAAGMGTRTNPPAAGAGAHSNIAGSGWKTAWNTSLATDTATLTAALHCTGNPTWTDAASGNENRPINCVTWYEAVAYCAWDGGFVPTEAEWNYVAAGGAEQRVNPWGAATATPARASYYVDATVQCCGDAINGCAVTDLIPVGSKSTGDGKWGQSDLGGNAYEWVLDLYQSPYSINPCNDCAELASGTYRVVRGGAYNFTSSDMRTGIRGNAPATARDDAFGFRCGRP